MLAAISDKADKISVNGIKKHLKEAKGNSLKKISAVKKMPSKLSPLLDKNLLKGQNAISALSPKLKSTLSPLNKVPSLKGKLNFSSNDDKSIDFTTK